MSLNMISDPSTFVAVVTKNQFEETLPLDIKQRQKLNGTLDLKENVNEENKQYKLDIVWRNVIIMAGLHLAAVYGVYILITGQAKLFTFIWAFLLAKIGTLGITAGAHRLWTHRSYKATWQLRVFLMVLQTVCFQNSVYDWVRDHRVHHKFTDTDADPHNSNRGFFFSHVGWLLVKKHNDVKEKGKTIDMTDLKADPIVMFQKSTFMILMPLLCFILPAVVPWYFWGESGRQSWFVCCALRYVLSLNGTWLVNSAAHMYGSRPYDKTISSVECKMVSFVVNGEGWHNYHHTFPWDYKASELPIYSHNFTLRFLNQMAKIGWAYDMKTVSPEMVAKRAVRTGDGTYKSTQAVEETTDENIMNKKLLWGWDDADLSKEDVQCCKILYRKTE